MSAPTLVSEAMLAPSPATLSRPQDTVLNESVPSVAVKSPVQLRASTTWLANGTGATFWRCVDFFEPFPMSTRISTSMPDWLLAQSRR